MQDRAASSCGQALRAETPIAALTTAVDSGWVLGRLSQWALRVARWYLGPLLRLRLLRRRAALAATVEMTRYVNEIWPIIDRLSREELGWTDTSLLHRRLRSSYLRDALASVRYLQGVGLLAVPVALASLATIIVGLYAVGLGGGATFVGAMGAVGVLFWRTVRGALVLAAASLLAGGTAWWSDPSRAVTAAARGATIGVAAILVVFALFFGIIGMFWRLWWRRYAGSQPAAAMTPLLAEVVLWLYGPDTAADVDAVVLRSIIGYLDRCAAVVEHALPRSLRIPSRGQDLLLRDRLKRSASVIRGYILWVALPNPSTRADLRRHCLQLLLTVAMGHYDLLPTDPVPVVDAHVRIRTIGAWVRNIVVAVVPLAGLLLVIQLGHLPGGALGTSIVFTVVLWTIVVFLNTLDPGLPAKIGMLKDLTTTTRPGGSTKSAP